MFIFCACRTSLSARLGHGSPCRPKAGASLIVWSILEKPLRGHMHPCILTLLQRAGLEQACEICLELQMADEAVGFRIGDGIMRP